MGHRVAFAVIVLFSAPRGAKPASETDAVGAAAAHREFR
jgi:hypothetical protein